jgi:hypothetical protein
MDLRSRKRRLAAAVVIAIAIAAAAGAFAALQSSGESSRPTFAERVAKNYRILTRAESRTLVKYAGSVYRCVTAHGANVGRPVASSKRILISAPHRSADALLRYLTACDAEVGPPPLKATLQARPGQILVYFPKQCLLSPTEVDTGAA